MKVVPEGILLDLLGRCIQLSQELLPLLATQGTRGASEPMVKEYLEIVGVLHQQKRHDSVLSDESWEWIWDCRKGVSHFQLYGRLAWLNYNLIDLM